MAPYKPVLRSPPNLAARRISRMIRERESFECLGIIKTAMAAAGEAAEAALGGRGQAAEVNSPISKRS